MSERYCLGCGKALEDTNAGEYHVRCLRRLFSSTTPPLIELNEKSIDQYLNKEISEGKTITGVQKKLSLGLDLRGSPVNRRLTLVGYPLGYILKPRSKDYPDIATSEALVMNLADELNIPTVPHGLVHLGDDELAYVTKRIDRQIGKDLTSESIPMEDFCQLLELPTSEKYQGSYERIAKGIARYSSKPVFDLSSFFILLVFCFLSGNSDMHLKNFSLIYKKGEYSLSPAYDLLPTNILLKEDEEETALALAGKKKNLTRNDFIAFAETIGFKKEVASKIIDAMLIKEPVFIEMTKHSFMSSKGKEDFESLLRERFERLAKKTSAD